MTPPRTQLLMNFNLSLAAGLVLLAALLGVFEDPSAFLRTAPSP